MKIKITKGGMKCCGVALVADLMAFSVSFISFKTIELSIVRTLYAFYQPYMHFIKPILFFVNNG
jgi:hypothetical protein